MFIYWAGGYDFVRCSALQFAILIGVFFCLIFTLPVAVEFNVAKEKGVLND